MRWQIANKAHIRVELAITGLISKEREWNNNCFIKFLKLQKFGNTSKKKRENPSKMEKT